MDGLIGRRAFLAGAAGAAVLAACGGGDGEGAGSGTTSTTSTTADSGISVGLLGSQFVAGREQRVAFVLLEDNRPLGRGTEVEVSFGPDGPAVPAVLHDDGIPTPYFLASTTVDRPGEVVMDVRVGGRTVRRSPLDFVDEASVEVPLPGDRMVPAETPTPADHRGVEPFCTANPPCPLHDVTLAAALAERRPVAVLFATPALCQTRLCGPVLDLLVAEREAFAGVRFVHVEVYTNLTDFQPTEGMKAYGLTFEPVLFLAGADGVVRERLDGSYDRTELRDALGRLAAS